MNKKVLSAILFSALFACTGTFTSCIDNDEPEGIENLRGAKAELLRAKVAVEQADAAYKLAQAELEKAKAAKELAEARIKEAVAAKKEAEAEKQAALTEEEKARVEAQIAWYQQQIEENALKHQNAVLTLELQLADAKRLYDVTMKQIEIAKALMNDGQLQDIEDLEKIVETKQVAVDKAMIKVKKAEQDVYNVAMNLDKDNAYWTSKLALDLKYEEKILASKKDDVDYYKNYIENLEHADWYQEIQDITVELDSLNDEKIALEVAKVREYNSEEYLALVDSLKAAQLAKTAIKAPKGTEDLSYTYLYWAGEKNKKVTVPAKDQDLVGVGDAIAGDGFEEAEEYGAGIKALEDEIAKYTEEYKAYLDRVKAADATTGLADAKTKSDAAVAAWTAALADYNTAKTTAKDVTYTGIIAKYNAYDEALKELGAAPVVGVNGATNEDVYKHYVATIQLKEGFADDLVAFYDGLPAGQVTFNSLALKFVEEVKYGASTLTKTTYVSKTAKEWLSDDNKAEYLDRLVKECFGANGFYGYWGEGDATKVTFTNEFGEKSEYTTAKDAFDRPVISKTAYIQSKLDALQDASIAAFGPAADYIDTNLTKVKWNGVEYVYLYVQPSNEDVKRAGYANGGEYNAYLGYEDDENVWLAKNYTDVLADYEAAIEYWTAAVEDIKEALTAYNDELDAAQDVIDAADKALADENAAIEAKYAAEEEILARRAMILTNIKNKLEQYAGVGTPGFTSVEEWLEACVKEAEYAVVEQEAVVLAIEKAIQEMEDGMHASAVALEAAEYRLAIDTRNLEKAQAELAEALANLQTALEIMSAE